MPRSDRSALATMRAWSLSMWSVDGASKRTSKRSADGGATWPCTVGGARSPPVRPLKRPPEVSMPRVQLAFFTITVPVTTGDAAGPCSASVTSTSERMPSGYRSRRSCPSAVTSNSLNWYADRPMRPPKRTGPPPSRAVTPSRRTPEASNVTMPFDLFEGIRKRQLAKAAAGQQRVNRHHRLARGAGNARASLRRDPSCGRRQRIPAGRRGWRRHWPGAPATDRAGRQSP